MQTVVGPRRCSLGGKLVQVHGPQHAGGLLDGTRRIVETQGDPGGLYKAVDALRVVTLTAEFAAQRSLILLQTTACDDGVDVHPVHLSGETVPRGRIVGGALAEEDHHHRSSGIVLIGQIRHAGLRGGQTGGGPEVPDLGRVHRKQRIGEHP